MPVLQKRADTRRKKALFLNSNEALFSLLSRPFLEESMDLIQW